MNDDAALGRPTRSEKPTKKKKGGAATDEEGFPATLQPLKSLADEGFRAAVIAAGGSIGAVISDAGELRVWGTFGVCPSYLLSLRYD